MYQDVGTGLICVLAELRIPQVVVLGDGAGAYIALRSVLCQGIYIEEKAKVVAAVLGTYLNAAQNI